MKPVLLKILVVALLLQLGLPLLLLVLKNRVLFYPAPEPTAADGLPLLAGVDARLIEVARPDGRMLTGYDARPTGAADTPVLLYFHGNAGNVAGRARWLAGFVRSSGLRVVLASYSGYGGNAGSPSEDELERDALAFHDHLTENGVAADQLVVYGESIGGTAALRVASERPCAGAIVQSTLASLSSMAGHVYPWLPLCGVLTRGSFPNDERATGLRVPLWIVHGTDDEIVPYSEGETLRAAAPAAEFLPIEGARHNDLFEVAGEVYLKEIALRVRRWTSR
ncbi:MAG: hypothetical protein GY711_12335 [bacterium]|nr:hypothetical protein [bacterium]